MIDLYGVAVSGSGAAEDRIGPVARDLGKEFLTVAEDRGGIDLIVVRIEEVASASPDQRDCVALRSIPVGQFHEGNVWKLAIYLDQRYVHGGSPVEMVPPTMSETRLQPGG